MAQTQGAGCHRQQWVVHSVIVQTKLIFCLYTVLSLNVTLFLCEKVMVCTITSSTINILDLQLLVEAQTGCTFYVKINYKQHS